MNLSFNSGSVNPFNMKVRRQKFGIGSLLFLLLFGLVFTFFGILAVKSTKIDPSWQIISGQVTSSTNSIGSNSSTTYAPVVSYIVGGQTYQVTSSSSTSSLPQIGSSRQVAYNPSQPAQSKVVESAGSKAILYIFPAIGILCLLLAPFLFIRSMRRSNAITSLTQNGQKVQGVLVDVQTTSGGNNSSSYKIVVAASNQTGGVQNYVSDSLAGIGGLAMADFRNTPIPIDVYIDPVNPSSYYVDVSDIPNLTPDRIMQLIRSAVSPTSQSAVPTQATQNNGAAPTQFAAPPYPTISQPPFQAQRPQQPQQPAQQQVAQTYPPEQQPPAATPYS